MNISFFAAPIVGGYSIDAREESIRNMEAHENQIGGYFLDGFHNGAESATEVSSKKVKEIVAKCTALLKEDKLRCILGAYTPLLTVELVQLGIDVFDTSYVYIATQSNKALVFRCDVDANNTETTSELTIDLTDDK